MKFEVRQVDAWAYDEGFEYNETFHLFDFECKGKKDVRSFKRALNRHGITLTPKCLTYSPDGDMLEVIVRKTNKPLFCAIPCYEND